MSRKKTYKDYYDYLKSDKWTEVRNQYDDIVFKDGIFSCGFCGSLEKGDYHHFRYPKDWNNDEWSNIIHLCSECHTLVHTVFNKKQFNTLHEFIHAMAFLNKVGRVKYDIAMSELDKHCLNAVKMVDIRAIIKSNGGSHVF